MLSLTRSLAVEWGRSEIRVNAVGSGWSTAEDVPLDVQREELLVRYTPLRRKGHPRDLAAMLVYLCSPHCDYPSGQPVYIDGRDERTSVGQKVKPMPALDNITIRGFKSIKSVERLKLNPINVLIGANGSGKSNFLEAFSLVREVIDGRLRQFVVQSGGAERILHFGSRVYGRD